MKRSDYWINVLCMQVRAIAGDPPYKVEIKPKGGGDAIWESEWLWDEDEIAAAKEAAAKWIAAQEPVR